MKQFGGITYPGRRERFGRHWNILKKDKSKDGRVSFDKCTFGLSPAHVTGYGH